MWFLAKKQQKCLTANSTWLFIIHSEENPKIAVGWTETIIVKLNSSVWCKNERIFKMKFR